MKKTMLIIVAVFAVCLYFVPTAEAGRTHQEILQDADEAVQRVCGSLVPFMDRPDKVTGTRLTLAPPPIMTPYLEKNDRQMTFPPRFGEHNEKYYGQLGYSSEDLADLKEKGVI